MKRLRWLLLLPFAVTVHGLVTAAPWLTEPTLGWPSLPRGNAAVWGSLVCLAALVLLGRPQGVLRRSAQAAGVLAIAYAPAGYLLTGNWRLEFTAGRDGTPWWWFTGALVALLLANLVWSLFAGHAGTGAAHRAAGD